MFKVYILILFTYSASTFAICSEVEGVFNKFLSLEKLSAKQRSTIRGTAQVKEFLGKWKDQKVISDNRAFMSSMDRASGSSQKRIYFDVENSVLKGLNDHVLEDKGLGDAVNNLFNQKFLKNLKSHPDLLDKISGQYSDFKSMRFSFDYKDASEADSINKALAEVYQKSNDEFLLEMDKAKMAGLWQGHEGQLGSPQTWFLAGTGDNALEANMASRAQRRNVASTGVASLSKYSDNVDELYSQMRGISGLQSELASNQKLVSKSIMTKVNDDYVLSKEMITILRKNKRSDFSSEAKYLKEIEQKSKSLFGVKLEKDEILKMTKYFEDIDSMSPPLFIRDRQIINLEEAKSGLVSVDFAGIGVDNAQAAMIGLGKSSMNDAKKMNSVSKTLDNVWKEVDSVTDEMHMAQRSYNSAVKEIEPTHSGALFSGDDGMFFPTKSWSRDEKVKLVEKLSQKDPSKYRVTFVPTQYSDGTLISAANRSEYVVKAEKVEKSLRAKVTGVGKDKVHFNRAKDLIFAIEYNPTKDGNGTFNLIVKGGELSPKELKSIHKVFSQTIEEGSSAGIIIH
ncbi:hypothetical protein [Halobacteriovorax sp. HLS]|uniref:hypothetical protein n=1 Tax=Halobacteriovorax sp. HLS TaxID=2234000 RepID=UPI000FDA9A7D|nr:hypothetical protein [Halobacteriovorax sp. HLS]